MGEAVQEPDVQLVGNAFVLQYYHVLHHSPEHVHRFYQDNSEIGRPGADGVMTVTTTMQAIKEKILSLDYGEFRAEIKTVDTQGSFGGGVIVLVTGYLTGKDEVTRNFTQVFFLAPQEKGYFVLNDVFRYVDDVKAQGAHVPVSEIENHCTQDTPMEETPVLENTTVMDEEPSEKLPVSVARSESPDIAPEEPVTKTVNETHEIVQSSPEPRKAEKEFHKQSYASMVKVPAAAPLANTVSTASNEVLRPVAKQMKAPTAAPADTETLSKDAVENGHEHETSYSIYIKALPLDATPIQIEAEFKQFGPIKRGGVQVRSSKGFCYGFVEFEEANSALKALKASTIIISGHEVFIQEKTSTNSGVNKQRFSAGRGNGFKNEDNRGRGSNGGGRGSHGRNSFTNSDQNGKGNNQQGFNNRGTRNGYRRFDNGNNRHTPKMVDNRPITPRSPAAA